MIGRDPLDDPLDDILAAPIRETAPAVPAHVQEAADYFQPCPKCRGTGRFTSYAGRTLGQCFACNGKGGKHTKTAPAVLAANRSRRADAKAMVERDALATFAADHPAEFAWMIERSPHFEFAKEMIEAVRKFGSLTEKQMAAVRKCMMADAERGAKREAKRIETSGEIDVTKLDEAFAVARRNGALVAAIRTGAIVFSLAKAESRNPGAIYCKTRSGGEYLGKIMGGRFSSSFACTAEHKEMIVEAAADPKAAALRYAAETDECSICGRLLTDPESKAAGIGPVCAAKFGW